MVPAISKRFDSSPTTKFGTPIGDLSFHQCLSTVLFIRIKCLSICFSFNQEETKVVTIDGYEDVGESDGDLLCATVQQPISVGIDGSALDFQLYTGVSLLAVHPSSVLDV